MGNYVRKCKIVSLREVLDYWQRKSWRTMIFKFLEFELLFIEEYSG